MGDETPMIPEWFSMAMAPLFKTLLMVGFGWAVAHGVFTTEQSKDLATVLVPALVVGVWGFMHRKHERELFNTAAATPVKMTRNEAKMIVKQGKGAPASVPQNRVPYLPGSKPPKYSTDTK